MKLLSLNVGLPKPVLYHDRLIETGIFKSPVEGSVKLSEMGLAGDGQADLTVHGGTFKAVYVYDRSMYDYWAQKLNRTDFAWGQFGENFTTENMPDDVVCIGDVYRIGTAIVQVTQPRSPCFKLGVRMNDATFVKAFLQPCHVGFYFRVLQPGSVAAGDSFTLQTPDPQRLSVAEVCRLKYFDTKNIDGIERVLAIAGLSPTWRETFEKQHAGARLANS